MALLTLPVGYSGTRQMVLQVQSVLPELLELLALPVLLGLPEQLDSLFQRVPRVLPEFLDS